MYAIFYTTTDNDSTKVYRYEDSYGHRTWAIEDVPDVMANMPNEDYPPNFRVIWATEVFEEIYMG